ncbi:hypothetical protein PENDEC_c037G03578 [Penicillium decumbens]|uniref:RRM domain-containing protein n=1 Tax=Penicillium decumbens TaxID=69771 RepID=A0A1V6NSP9_PENDC|nr:hypothetical protein PENDEC_c037G03578 [Penicillium decumbens]
MDTFLVFFTDWLLPEYPDGYLLATFVYLFFFVLAVANFLRSIMVHLAGTSTGWLPISKERLQELVAAQESIYSVISDYCEKKGRSLEESIHAVPGVSIFRPDPDRKPMVNYSFVTEHSMSNGDFHRSYSGSTGSSSINPEAAAFSPGDPPVFRGVRTPEEFMASLRAAQARRRASAAIPARRIVFGNLPEGTSVSDVLCMVHGGAVERAWSVVEGEVIVQFIDDGACARYYAIHSAGILVHGNHVITVAQPDNTDPLTPRQRERIMSGVTRLVSISGIVNEAFVNLCTITKGYEIDHILLAECDRPGISYVFFRNITHAWDFKIHAEEDVDNWGDCVFDYIPDPCLVARGFHENNLETRFCDAVTLDNN